MSKMEHFISRQFAAKSCMNDNTKWLSFDTHSLDTAGIMKNLIKKWIPDSVRDVLLRDMKSLYDVEDCEDVVVRTCELIALLHDIGKLTPAFQSKIAPHIENYSEKLENAGFSIMGITAPNDSPHDIAGQAILHFHNFPQEILAIVGAHHGRPHGIFRKQMSLFSVNYFGKSKDKKWQELWDSWINYSMKITGFGSIERIPKPGIRAQMIITAVLIMSDWIASNTSYFPLVDIDEAEIDCVKRVKQAYEKVGLTFPEMFEERDMTPFSDRFGFEPNIFQHEVIQTCSNIHKPGIMILEAPMGLGKTEAALAAAEIAAKKCGAGGIFFGLPTQATANGIFGRIKAWAEHSCDGETHSIRLAHGMIDLNDEYRSIFRGTSNDSEDGSIIIHEWFEGRKQALLSDYVIATIDQFLLVSLKQKHVMLRHLGLAGKVVILDECHAYDAYMNVYLDHTLRWMSAYEVPVIILSATLPPERRNQLISAYLDEETTLDNSISAYPVITWTDNSQVFQKAVDSQLEQKEIELINIDESKLIDILRDRLVLGGCAGVIVNTVRYAQQLAKAIAAKLPEYRVICFHSRYIQTDRAKTERLVLNLAGKYSNVSSRNKLIIVGTQVIEQSLDIDFDFMVSEICPIDLLLQRSGRLHRHKRKRTALTQKPVLAILKPADEKQTESTCDMYSKWLIHETQRILSDKLVIPDHIPVLVGKVYKTPEKDSTENYSEWQEYDLNIRQKRRKAECFCIRSDEIDDSDTFDELIDDNKGDDPGAEASVRDAEESIEILVLKRSVDGVLTFISESNNQTLDTSYTPDADTARKIASQRLRLPPFFSKRFSETIRALDVMPKMWRTSAWLRNENLLILDENMQAEINGCHLVYSESYGLEYKKGSE